MFTSSEFYRAAADECQTMAKWLGELAQKRGVEGFGRNSQIYDLYKRRESEFRRGGELAALGDYEPVWKVARLLGGDTRGILDQPLHAWMTEEEANEFEILRMGRLQAYWETIELSLNNAMYGASSFFNPDPDFSDRRQDDDGFPGGGIVERYSSYINYYEEPFFWKLKEPISDCTIDKSVACETGDEVPWTGVWYPITGLEGYSLAFAVKGRRMQPAYRIVKSKEQLKAEGILMPTAKTIAVATVWHPVVESLPSPAGNDELWAKAGQQCPKEGIWQPTDPGAAPRYYRVGESMINLGSAYGFTVWRWMADR